MNKKSKAVQAQIRQSASKWDMWQSSGFKSWIDHYDTVPNQSEPCAFLLCCDGGLSELFNGYGPCNVLSEFESIVEKSDFYWEMMDGGTIGFFVKDKSLKQAYGDMISWQWNSSLIAPSYALIHESIFAYFSGKGVPGFLKLKPREFEIYLESVFQNQDYKTELGPGGNDQGIDLRLYSNDVTGDVLTLVQAKRYSPKYAIRLDAIKALTTTVDYEPAEKGIFVTTSRFLPSARRFAERKAPHIHLIGGADLLRITEDAAKSVWEKRKELLQPKNIAKLIENRTAGKLDGQIMHASTGIGITNNAFALCLKVTAGAALLCPIPKKDVNEKVHYTVGYEVPDLGTLHSCDFKLDDIFMAKRFEVSQTGQERLWGNTQLYSVWDGKPQYFDLND